LLNVEEDQTGAEEEQVTKSHPFLVEYGMRKTIGGQGRKLPYMFRPTELIL
jgi:hypothetical protein